MDMLAVMILADTSESRSRQIGGAGRVLWFWASRGTEALAVQAPGLIAHDSEVVKGRSEPRISVSVSTYSANMAFNSPTSSLVSDIFYPVA